MSASVVAAVEGLGFPTCGQSSEGRSLAVQRFGPSAEAPVIIMAGIHGNEPASVEAVLELMPSLSAVSRTVWVVPALNPDGLVRGSKDSARGVDLNRNFPARNFNLEHKPRYFPGHGPASEPETRAFVSLVEQVSPRAVVAVHAPFACVNFDGPAKDWAARVSAASGWPVWDDIGYPTPGSLGSWLGHDRGLPVLTLELPEGDYGAFRSRALAALVAAVEGAP